MTIKKIKEILAQENYKVENGKVYRLDAFGDWSEQKENPKKQIQLRAENGYAELVDWNVVKDVISGKYDGSDVPQNLKDEHYTFVKGDTIPIIESGVPTIEKIKQEKAPQVSKAKKEVRQAKKERTALRSAEIKLIRKMLEDKKSINSMATALGTNRFAIQYIVKQIKAGKKLMHEK